MRRPNIRPQDVRLLDVSPLNVRPLVVRSPIITPLDVRPLVETPVDVRPLPVISLVVRLLSVRSLDVRPLVETPQNVRPLPVTPLDVRPLVETPLNVMPKISYYLRTATNLKMTVPFMYNFETYLINSLRFSESSFLTFHSQVMLFFAEKGILKFSYSKI